MTLREVNEVKKRIAKRKKERYSNKNTSITPRRNDYFLVKDEERYGEQPFYDDDHEHSSYSNSPLFHKEMIIFQILMATSLFLVVAILFKDTSPRWENARNFISSTMEKEFQFAAVLDWYEDQFGQPVAIFPSSKEEAVNNSNEEDVTQVYAVPAAGRVLEPFSKEKKGIMVQTGPGAFVEAVDEGIVIDVGVKENIGKTVIVQHSDGSETWYGNLQSIDVKLYDFIESRTRLGQVTNTEDGQSGTFYFAIKEGDVFIDPIQVVHFE